MRGLGFRDDSFSGSNPIIKQSLANSRRAFSFDAFPFPLIFMRRFLLLILLLAMALGLIACSNTPNYLDNDMPRYSGSYSVSPPVDDGVLKIVSWNIKYARDIDGAIETFDSSPELQQADVVLLQEMDNEGTDALARSLKMNYVYYPASVHPKTGRDFGEAILSPWPLSDDAKIFLPHESPRNGQIRIAVRAWVQTPGQPLLAYSVHTEMTLMPPWQRIDQIRVLQASVPDDAHQVVIGGDFNTLTPIERYYLVRMMNKEGFEWLTKDGGATVEEKGVGMVLDYIFARGLEAINSGVVDSEASDHLPLWVQAKPKP